MGAVDEVVFFPVVSSPLPLLLLSTSENFLRFFALLLRIFVYCAALCFVYHSFSSMALCNLNYFSSDFQEFLFLLALAKRSLFLSFGNVCAIFCLSTQNIVLYVSWSDRRLNKVAPLPFSTFQIDLICFVFVLLCFSLCYPFKSTKSFSFRILNPYDSSNVVLFHYNYTCSWCAWVYLKQEKKHNFIVYSKSTEPRFVHRILNEWIEVLNNLRDLKKVAASHNKSLDDGHYSVVQGPIRFERMICSLLMEYVWYLLSLHFYFQA